MWREEVVQGGSVEQIVGDEGVEGRRVEEVGGWEEVLVRAGGPGEPARGLHETRRGDEHPGVRRPVPAEDGVQARDQVWVRLAVSDLRRGVLLDEVEDGLQRRCERAEARATEAVQEGSHAAGEKVGASARRLSAELGHKVGGGPRHQFRAAVQPARPPPREERPHALQRPCERRPCTATICVAVPVRLGQRQPQPAAGFAAGVSRAGVLGGRRAELLDGGPDVRVLRADRRE